MFYRDFAIKTIVESEDYPLDEMLNEFAGIVGLYFGLSVIAVAVVTSMIIEAIKIVITRVRKGKEIPMISELDVIIM